MKLKNEGWDLDMCKHSILHPWFNQGRWLEWPSMYPKVMCFILGYISNQSHVVSYDQYKFICKSIKWGIFQYWCTYSILHPWLNQGKWPEWPYMYLKNHDCITCINSFIAHHKNDFEISMVTAVCSIFKLDRRIKRYHMIKFAQSTCIVSR